MKEVLVIGHRNPDTDAICSAIGYAEFKRRTGMPEAIAARCGDTNDRIDYVLNRFETPAPRFIADVSPKIRDVMQSNVISVLPDTTVADALRIIDEKNIRVLPVLNADRTCCGLISVFKMSKFFFPMPNRIGDTRKILASIQNLAHSLGARILHAVDAEREEELILMIGAMTVVSFDKRMLASQPERLVVVVGDREDIQNHAIERKARVIVVTGDLPVSPETLEMARANGVSLLISPHDSATTAMLSRASIAVKHMLHEHYLSFREDEALALVEPLAAASNFQAFPVLDQNRRTVGILSKSDFLKKVERRLILVDHNELTQAVHGIEQVEIIEIVDHHRVQIHTAHPILIRNEPVGSTSTIVADCFLRHGLAISKNIAGLLLAGLISDTLNLTSPTTTAHDAEILKILEQSAEVNAREFTDTLFASGSVLISRPAPQAITSDCKEYVEQGKSFSVAQIEELGFEQFWKRKTDVVTALEAYRRQKGYDFSALLLTDVVTQISLLLVAGPADLLSKIDYPELEDGIWELENVVSRKKQLLPYFSHLLKRLS